MAKETGFMFVGLPLVLKGQGQSTGTAGRAVALIAADPDLISSTPYGSPVLPGMTPSKTKNK